MNEHINTTLKHTPSNPLDETDRYPRGRVKNIAPETDETMIENTYKLNQRRNDMVLDQDEAQAQPQ